MKICNTINEVEEQLKHSITNSDKIEFLKQQLNLRRYFIKKGLTVTDLTEIKTGRIFKGLSEFGDEVIELSLKQDEVLRFIEIEIEYLKALPPQQAETKTDKLKVNQIALIHVYEGIQITRENAGEIAAKHGYTAKNSGEGLFQDYTNYSSTANRKGKPTPCTPRKLKNKIELFKSVLNHLSENNKQKAFDEIKILKTIYENEYQ